MNPLLLKLDRKEQSGSRARCVLLTHDSRQEVAERLTAMAAPHASIDPERHVWAPNGFTCPDEAKLGQTAPFVDAEGREALTAWWLAVRHARANTPNWDIVSQATFEGREGLMLVEAKAHERELTYEMRGKPLATDASPNSQLNHRQIGDCITSMSQALCTETGLAWSVSRDANYQMANRFAWACRLTQMGIPVVLVYLGFLNATEMRPHGPLLRDHAHWAKLVREHSRPLFPDEVWGRSWEIHGTSLTPLIRSATVDLCTGAVSSADSGLSSRRVSSRGSESAPRIEQCEGS